MIKIEIGYKEDGIWEKICNAHKCHSWYDVVFDRTINELNNIFEPKEQIESKEQCKSCGANM